VSRHACNEDQTKAVTQRHADGIKEKDDEISAEQPDQRVDAGQTVDIFRPNESSPSAMNGQ